MDKEINRFISGWREQKKKKKRRKALISYLKNLSFLRHVSHMYEGIPRSRLLSKPRSKPKFLERNFISVHTMAS